MQIDNDGYWNGPALQQRLLECNKRSISPVSGLGLITHTTKLCLRNFALCAGGVNRLPEMLHVRAGKPFLQLQCTKSFCNNGLQCLNCSRAFGSIC